MCLRSGESVSLSQEDLPARGVLVGSGDDEDGGWSFPECSARRRAHGHDEGEEIGARSVARNPQDASARCGYSPVADVRDPLPEVGRRTRPRRNDAIVSDRQAVAAVEHGARRLVPGGHATVPIEYEHPGGQQMLDQRSDHVTGRSGV
jgi:hypothetical protein